MVVTQWIPDWDLSLNWDNIVDIDPFVLQNENVLFVLHVIGFLIEVYWYPHWENRVSFGIKVSPDLGSIVDINHCQ